MDRITIQNLEIFANHGMFQEETRLGQKFQISAELLLNLREAGLSDSIQKSIHYGEVCQYITSYLEEHTFQLIEAAAENLACELLLSIQPLEGISIEIKKPWAPIGLPIETVSVRMERAWHTVYLSAGSNLGDRESLIQDAVKELEQTSFFDRTGAIRNVALSGLIETKAYGKTDQPDFINGAIRLETIMDPSELLNRLHEIEQSAGRERVQRWGARTLDLDILFYDDLILEQTDLTVPHIDMKNRLFVLEPLMDLCPGKVHPVYRKTVSDLYAELSGKEFVNVQVTAR